MATNNNKKMKTLITVFTVCLLISCGNSSAVSKQLSGTDSLVINFNAPQTNTIKSTLTTTENTAIKKLTNYVDSKTSEAYKCGYDGNLLFYRKGIVVGDVSFNFSGDGCDHFLMLVDGELIPTTMSNEAASFLKSLAEGKDWY